MQKATNLGYLTIFQLNSKDTLDFIAVVCYNSIII